MRYCPYHDTDHLDAEWTCPNPPPGMPAYVGWSDAAKARAFARMVGTPPRDPLMEGVGIDEYGDG